MKGGLSDIAKVFGARRVLILAPLGFASGLPLSLTGSTLQAWMAVEGVDVASIGLLSLAGAPYAMKFLWAPVMDRFVPPFLGRRRGWIVITQLAIAACVAAMSFSSPAANPYYPAVAALLLAFFSASQDIVADAYRTDILHKEERGAGTAVFITGYRVAVLVSGALALMLSGTIGWNSVMLLMAAFMVIGPVAALLAPEPEGAIAPPRNLREAVIAPLENYSARNAAAASLFLIVLYKLGDAYAGALTTAFLIQGLSFGAGEVGAVNKGLGMASTIAGAALGGSLMVRMGLFRSLLYFGVLQAVSNLSFMALALAGKSHAGLVFAVAFENFTSGMGTAAFVAFLMAMCDRRYSATQFALLSSIAALGRTFIAPTSGFVAGWLGWAGFFAVSAAAAVPGLALLWTMRGVVERLESENGGGQKEVG